MKNPTIYETVENNRETRYLFTDWMSLTDDQRRTAFAYFFGLHTSSLSGEFRHRFNDHLGQAISYARRIGQ